MIFLRGFGCNPFAVFNTFYRNPKENLGKPWEKNPSLALKKPWKSHMKVYIAKYLWVVAYVLRLRAILHNIYIYIIWRFPKIGVPQIISRGFSITVNSPSIAPLLHLSSQEAASRKASALGASKSKFFITNHYKVRILLLGSTILQIHQRWVIWNIMKWYRPLL